MPGQDDLIHILNADLEKAQIKEVIAALGPLKDEIKNFAGISFFTKNTNGSAEFRAQATQLTEALARIKQVETELDALRTSHAVKNKARTDQELADQQRKGEATRARVKDIRAEEDAYKKLTNEYTKAAKEAKILAAQYGVHSKEAKEATKAAKALGEQISEINKVTGNNAPGTGVGRYAQGIKEFAKEALIAGGAAFGLHAAFDFIKDSVKEFMQQQEALSRFSNILSNVGRSDLLGELSVDADRFAKSLGTVKDEQVTEVFTKLITYGKLSKNQMTELLPVIADFAQKTGRTLPDAATVFTAALEGTGKELKKEFGVNMKDGANVTERFGIIMGELKPKVEGAAQAFGETLAGSMKKSEIAIEDLKRQIGEEFAPTVQKSERFLLAFVSRIPEWFSSADEAIGRLKASVAGFFGFTGLQKEFEAYDKLKKEKKEYKEQTEQLEDIKAIAAKHTIKQQEDDIAGQELLFKHQYEYLQLILKTGQAKTANGAHAAYEASQTKRTLDALKEQLKSSKDTSVVGNGDPNDIGKEAREAAMLKEIEAQAKLYAMRLQAAIDYQKILADEKNNTIASRTAAYRLLIDLEEKQVEGERDLKLKNAKLTEGEREVIIYEAEQKLMKYRVENIERLAKIRFDAANDDKIQAAADFKELEALEALHIKALEDMRIKALAKKKAYIEDARSIELLANERALGSKVDPKSKKKYQTNADQINNAADLANLKDDRSDAISQLPTADSDKRVSLEARISQLNLEIYKKEHEDKKKMDEDAFAEKQKLSGLEIQAAKEVGHAIESFVSGVYERQINAIQKQIDKNNELKEKETSAIANSTLSLQEKASAQILLDAKVNANNEALQRRQRDLKVKEAQFNRAAAIVEIIEQGAIAAVAALKIPIYGEAEAIAIGIITAAQVASVLAKPIPTYATGTDNHPGGPMIVHPGEMRVDPDGKISMTPDAPQTLTYGQRGTKIIPADEVNRMMLSDIMRMQVREMKQDRTEELLTALLESSQNQISAMKRKQVIHNHIHWNPGFNDHLKNAL